MHSSTPPSRLGRSLATDSRSGSLLYQKGPKRIPCVMLSRYSKIALGSAAAAIFGILFGWVMFPAILKMMLKKEMALSKKTDVRQMWEKIPFALDFKVYLFNYTNPEEVQRGGVPIVREVGPYHFDEWKEKMEIEDHAENDTITYKRKDTFFFNRKLSGPGLTGDEIVIMPHLFILAVAKVVSMDRPAMLNVVGKAFNGIFENPPDIFMRVKAMDILFNGMNINCSRTEFAPKALCTALKKENINGLSAMPDNQYSFSLFGSRNATVDPIVVTVKRGIKQIMEVGQVVALDGKPQMDIWSGACNEYQGTDGTVFPPFLTEKDRIQSFSAELCRSFKPWYEKKTSYRGLKTNRYVANIGDFANDPELHCFCGEKCPPKGVMDLMKCLKAPLYATMPHFLDTDPSIQKNVKGLTPNIERHGIEIDFEPISGTPLVAKQRLQLNIELMQSDKIELLKQLPGTVVPLVWLEEGLALNKTFINMLKYQLFIPKKIVGAVKWMLVSFGTVGVFIGAMLMNKDRIMSFATTTSSASKVKPQEEEKEVSIIGQQQPPEPAKIQM